MFGRLIGLLCLAASTAVAMAGPQTYVQRAQNIRAGIVILASAKTSSTAQPTSAGPHALYNLDSNTSIKPAGWNFYNPFAPTTVSQTIFNRWSQIDASTPAVTTRISKRNAPYWEISLSLTSDSTLANYDLLLVNPSTYASLNPAEQERLRRFVDNGGVLWIDPAGMNNSNAGMDQFNNFPIPFLQMSVAVFGNEQTDFSNALMSNIHRLTANDISVLNAASPTSYVLQPVNLGLDGPAAANMAGLAGGTTYDFSRFQPVSVINNQPSVALGRIGAGIVVVTARGASLKLNRSQEATSYTGNGSNNGYAALDPVLEQDGLAAAKLAVNMVGLLRESRQQAASSRKVSSSAIDLNPPLIQRSFVNDANYALNLTGAGYSNATPALYKGLMVTTVGGVVKVYNANPSVDLDGSGNFDAGIRDHSLGASYDLVWQSQQLPAPVSAPVCAEVPGTALGYPQDEVLVVDATGTLHIFNLMPRNADGTLSGVAVETNPIAPPNGAATLDGNATGIPMAPTVHEGIAYIVDNYQKVGVNGGRVWQVDLQQGRLLQSAGPFVIGGLNSNVSLPEFCYGATVGYIPIADNSGGVDKVLYVPFQANTSQGINGAGFVSLWLGAKGEVPTSYSPTGTDTATALTVNTRVGSHGNLPIYTGTGSLGVKLTLLDSSGNPFTDAQMAGIFTGNVQDLGGGELSFPFQGTVTQLPSTVSGIRVDYTIDWGSAQQALLFSIERGRVILPDVAQAPTRIINGGVALSPQGTIYVVNSNAPAGSPTSAAAPGGGLYGFREQGFGVFNCVNRYELYGKNTVILNQAGSYVDSVGVMADNDDLTRAFPQFTNILSQPMGTYQIRGGPSIRNGYVYVTASAIKSGGTPSVPLPVTILMAFSAEPQTPTFAVGDLPTGSEILQPDFARSTNQSSPENQTLMNMSQQVNGVGGYVYDSSTGLISFPSLMSNQQGQMQNCISLSQPIIVRKPGSPDNLVFPDAVGGAVWSPLQWYFVLDAAYPSGGAPVATGNSVFMSCDSYMPAFLSGGGLSTTGVLYAVNGQIPATQLHPLAAKPWVKQLWTLELSNSPFIGDPNILWPQISTVTSVNDFQIKLNQTVLGGASGNPSTFAYGIAGGDNSITAWGNGGIYTFAKGNFMVCDEGRIVEMDASGNPIWSSDVAASTGQTSVNGSAGLKPLVRPVKAYQLTDSTILFADAGANRVAIVSKTGVETRSISSFQLDPNIAPNGYSPGESLSLSSPRDAVYYTTYTNMGLAGSLVTMGDGENNNNVEFWLHYLIADAGNKRLVEVIDRYYYDPTTQYVGQPVTVGGVPQVGVLLWHSPAAVSGKQYAYSSITRLRFPDNSGGHYVYVTGFGGTLPTRVGTGLDTPAANALAEAQDGSGGIVIYDPANPAGVVTFSQMTLPDVSQTAFWDPTTGQFDNNIDTTTAAGRATMVRRKGGTRRIANLNSVTARMTTDGSNNPLVAIMVADSTGVYEVTYGAGQGATQTLDVDWMVPNEVFRNMQQARVGGNLVPTGQNAQDLRALYARRLDSGEVLIVNGYYGNTLGGAVFTGEVTQVDGTVNPSNFSVTNLGFGTKSITLDLRTAGATALRGLVMPVFADRR